MASNFKYQPRKAEDYEKRANQTGSTFISFIQDQFITFGAKKENWIRILPPTWPDPRHYGYDIWVHYSVGPQNAAVLCPLKMKSKPCPMCESFSKAESLGREDAKDMKPTRRVLMWIIDRKEEEAKSGKELMPWAAPWTFDRDLVKICKDRQSGELYQIDNPEAGYDVTFDVEGERPNIKYVGHQLMRRPSPVKDLYLEHILKYPAPSILLWRDYDEIIQLMEGAGPEAPPEEAKAGTTPSAEPPQSLCSKTFVFKGEILGCGHKAGHQEECDFVRELGPVNAVQTVALEAPAGFCEKTIVARGQKLGCALSPNHQGECDYDRRLGEGAKAQTTAAPTNGAVKEPVPQATAAAAPPSAAPRAAGLRQRLEAAKATK